MTSSIKKIVTHALALGCCVLSLSAFGEKVELDRIIAKVDQEVILHSEFQSRLATVKSQIKQRGMEMPADQLLMDQVLDLLILESIQNQMAKRAGITIDEWTLNSAIENIAQSNGLSIAGFKSKVEAEGVSYAQVREDIRREILLNRVRQQYLASRVSVSEQEVDNFLASPEGLASIRADYRLGHILLPTPDKPTPEQVQAVEKQANEIVARLKKGESFESLAASYSKGQKALEGGDMGWMSTEQLPTLFAQTAVKLDRGEVSAPVRSPSGFHIIKVTDLRGQSVVNEQQVNVRHILVKPSEIRTDTDAKMLMESIYKRAQKGQSFNELAKMYSEDPGSALNGGEMGWVSPKTLVPEFQTAVQLTPNNVVSEPFKTTYGWHILEVLGRRNADISNEVRRNQVREIIGQRKFQEELQAWLREIRDQAYVEVQG